MDYKQAVNLIKKQRKSIKEIEVIDIYTKDLINEIVNNEGNYILELGRIIYVNNINIPIELNLSDEVDITYDSNEDFINITELIDYKSSQLNAIYKNDLDLIKYPLCYSYILDEIDNINNFEKNHDIN